MMDTRKGTGLATLAGMGAILLWSTTVAIVRSLSEQVGPITGASAVFIVSGGIALVDFLCRRSRRSGILQLPAKYLVFCGALFVCYMLLLFLAIGWAENRQQVLEVGLLNYLWPVLTLVFSLVLLGNRAGWILIPGTFFSLLGILLVVTHAAPVSWHAFHENVSANPASYLLAIAAAVCWAMYSNLTRRWAGDQNEGAVILFLPVTAGTLLLLSCFSEESNTWTTRSFVEVLFLGIATYAAYVLWDHAMRRGNIIRVAAASYMTPLLSTIVSCLYLAIIPGARLWAGCCLLILGSMISWHAVSSASIVHSHSTIPGSTGRRRGCRPG